MKVNATLKNLRISPRKVQVIVNQLRGLKSDEAIAKLEMINRRPTKPLAKLLASAVANGENNFGLDRDNLRISEIKVGAGPTLKRWMPRAFGRATQILKRTSHITVILEEIEEGKNRKSPQELQKERKQRQKEQEKMIKEIAEDNEKAGQNQPKLEAKEHEEQKDIKPNKKQEKVGGWSNKIFRRKSN